MDSNRPIVNTSGFYHVSSILISYMYGPHNEGVRHWSDPICARIRVSNRLPDSIGWFLFEMHGWYQHRYDHHSWIVGYCGFTDPRNVLHAFVWGGFPNRLEWRFVKRFEQMLKRDWDNWDNCWHLIELEVWNVLTCFYYQLPDKHRGAFIVVYDVSRTSQNHIDFSRQNARVHLTCKVYRHDHRFACLSAGILYRSKALCKNPLLARRTATIRALTLCDCRVTYRDSLLKARYVEAVETGTYFTPPPGQSL